MRVGWILASIASLVGLSCEGFDEGDLTEPPDGSHCPDEAPGWCGETCVDTSSDPLHCGTCGAACAAPAAVASGLCVLGACVVGECTEDFADCDETYENGCETKLATSKQHCGTCTFRQQATSKGLDFSVQTQPGAPDLLYTDTRRVQQVLKNLLANSFKFTERGSVKLSISRAKGGWSANHDGLNRADAVIAFAVTDTGVGIPVHKQKLIFEAFQQADGTTSRKYGGTGLGLSISREIAKLLNGELTVKSAVGKGSTFTFYMPCTYLPNGMPGVSGISTTVPHGPLSVRYEAVKRDEKRERPWSGEVVDTVITTETDLIEPSGPVPSGEPPEPISFPPGEVEDDRDQLQPGDQSLLIIEDDVEFARILVGMAREKGFKVLVAGRGDTGLSLARHFKPAAITLDLSLPVMDGWSVLDALKHDPKTRHIPVHVISGKDDGRTESLRNGAIAFLQKPITREALADALGNVKGFIERRVKNLLIVEDNDTQRASLVELIGNGDVKTTAVSTAAEALIALREKHFDCLVTDLGLPDMAGVELIETIKGSYGLHDLPIVVYTGRDLTQEEETRLRRRTEAIIIKSVRSPEQLLDETALFLHRVHANLPESKRQILADVHQSDPIFAGRKILVVDDDVRNIYAITAVLERYDMTVLYAEDGRKGVEALRQNPDVDAVLMDVMMPEMDGYEAMREIRQNPKFAALPIIALTAKAMKGDREKCVEAGASEYVPKPVDPEQLVSLLRVWLYRQRK